MTSGQFNGDGFADLAISTATGVVIAMGDGAGGFTLGQTLMTPTGALNVPAGAALGMTAGLLGDDYYTDLAVVAPGANEVLVYRGNGNGFDAVPTHYASGGSQPIDVLVGDFVGDGRQDLAVGHRDGTLSLFEGMADGSLQFRSSLTVTGLGTIASLAAADVDEDGDLDLAVSGTNQVTVLYNGNDPQALPALVNSDFTTGLTGWTATTDVSALSGFAQLREGDALLTTLEQAFVVPQNPQTIEFDLLSLGLESPDGIPDAFEVSLLDAAGNSLVPTFRSDATSYFNANASAGGPVISLAAGVTKIGSRITLNISGLAAGSTARLVFDLVGNPGGKTSTISIDNVLITPTTVVNETFSRTTLAGPFGATSGIAAADVDGDGNVDLIVADSGAAKVLVFNGNGTGGFTRSELDVSGFGANPTAIATGLLTSDGVDDIAVVLTDTNRVLSPLANAFDIVPPTATFLSPTPGSLTNAAVTQVVVQFSEAMSNTGAAGNHSVTNAAAYRWTGAGVNGVFGDADDVTVAISGVSYNAVTRQATISTANPLADGFYRLTASGTNAAHALWDLAGNPLGGGVDAVMSLRVDRTAPVATLTGPAPGSTQSTDVSHLTIHFSEAVQDNGVTGSHSVTNPASYVLTSAGVNGTFGDADDVTVPLAAVSYNAITHDAVITFGAGFTPLPNAKYRLTLNSDPTLSLQDTAGNNLVAFTAVTFTVAVGVDHTAPTGTASFSPDHLWPPNHKMVNVTATLDISDDTDAHPTVELVSITSNEGDEANDVQEAAFGTDDRQFKLRAERLGSGDGRVYTITYRITDASGNSRLVVGTVCVAHDQGNGTGNPPSAGVAGARFLVVDDADNTTYGYQPDGAAQGSSGLVSANNRPVGVATRSGRDLFWVIDQNKSVYVYSGDGAPMGSWQTTGLNDPQDITVVGDDIWIVDKGTDRVYRFAGAVTRTSGQQAATSSFALLATNKNAMGIASDGAHVWVVDDSRDSIFKYSITGAYAGEWKLDSRNKDATGVTISPEGGTGLWVVDRKDSTVYYYGDGRTRTLGQVTATSTFALATANGDAQGIADPTFDVFLGDTLESGISEANPQDDWNFTGAAGQRLYIEALQGDVVWVLYGLGGEFVASGEGSAMLGIDLAAGEPYTLSVYGQEGFSGQYQIKLNSVPVTATTPIVLGQEVNGSIGLKGEVDRFVFDADAGEQLELISDQLGSDFYWTLSDSAGNMALDGYLDGTQPFQLADAGSYTLAIHGAYGATGAYSFRVDLAPATAITLGDFVEGELLLAGEQDRFVFSGTTGQIVVFDPVSELAAGELTWSLSGPSGTIFTSDFVSRVTTLAETGDYILTVLSPIGLSTNYQFATSSLPPGTLISVGDTIDGSIDADEQIDVYSINVVAGERVFFDKLAGSNDRFAWKILDANGVAVFEADEFSDPGTYQFGTAGTVLLIVESSHSDGDGPTTEPPGAYQFRTFTPPPPTVAPLTLGVLVSDSINVIGAEDHFTFSATAGQQLFFDVGFVSSRGFTLVGPDGAILMEERANDHDPLTVPLTGTYTVVVRSRSPRDSLGSYTFRVWDVPATVVEPIGLADPRSGTIAVPGEEDHYTFTGADGQIILLDQISNSGQVGFRILGPDGETVLANGFNDRQVQLFAAGTYTVVVGERSALDGTGSYEFQLLEVPPVVVTTYIALNELVTGSIGAPGEQDAFKFTVPAGQQVYFDTPPALGLPLTWSLRDPNGAIVFNTGFHDLATRTLLDAGEYTLLLDGTGAATPDYEFQLWDVPVDVPQTIALGDSVSITTVPGQTPTYTFTATAGQQVLVDVVDNPNDVRIRLNGPSGEAVFFARTASRMDILPATGTYTLVIGQSDSDRAGPFAFAITEVPAVVTTFQIGDVVSGEIAIPGERGFYAFQATAGQQVYFDEQVGPVEWFLTDPSGTVVFTTPSDTGGNYGPVTLSQTGEYRFTVRSFGTVPYTFQLWDVPVDVPEPILLNLPVSGELIAKAQTQTYTFTAAAGQKFVLEVSSNPADLRLTVRDPLGVTRSTTTGDADTVFTATVAGTYTLVVDEHSGNPEAFGSFTFRIQDASSPTVGGLDTRGTEFWLTMLPNAPWDEIFNPGQIPDMFLYISSEVDTTGTVQIPGINFYQAYTVVAGQVTTITLPPGAEISFGNRIQDRGILVTALDEVTVYSLSRKPRTSDASVIHPTDVLGTDHVVMAFPNQTPILVGTNAAVVATEDGTEIVITPTAAVSVNPAGVPYTMTLDKGQVYYISSLSSRTSDLTGTLISSNKPIAVYGGNSITNIPYQVRAADMIYEQLPSTDTWGQRFVTLPLAHRFGGDTFRILAAHDNTTVTLNGVVVATLNRGEFHEQIIDGPSEILADRPILVAQFSNGLDFDQAQQALVYPETVGDPFMLLVTPYEQFQSNYVVTTPATGFIKNYINVVVPNGSIGAVLLDGVAIPVSAFVPIGTSGFSGAQLEVSLGAHQLSSTVPFGASVYGYDLYDSYGYAGGLSLAPIAQVTSVSLVPETTSLALGSQHIATALVTDVNGDPLEGIRVDFQVAGANTLAGFAYTNAQGQAQFTYVGNIAGIDTITATVGTHNDTASVSWAANAGVLAILSPAPDSQATAGELVLITGRAQSGLPLGSIALVTVNGRPVDSLDALGNFFALVPISLGENSFMFTALDSFGQTVTLPYELTGVPESSGLDFENLSDVTGAATIAYSGTTFNRRTNTLLTNAQVVNRGADRLDSPVLARFDQITPPVALNSFDGTTSSGLPYVSFDTELSPEGLAGGASSAPITLAFADPSLTRFSVDVTLLAQGNLPPAFQSSPVTASAVDATYTYQAAATDPNGNVLTYRLDVAPQGMTIDAASGLVLWTPAADQLGVHQVELVASDGRGGLARQTFQLQVFPQTANRPPVFQSAPTTGAAAGSNYVYAPEVLDLDGDTLAYSLAVSPPGMTIDTTTGVVTFANAPQGSYAVTLQATDGRGGVANQSFVLSIGVANSNPGIPVATSTPPTHAIVGSLYAYQPSVLDSQGDTLTYSLLQKPTGMEIDSATGLITWTPTSGDLGPHTVELLVDDGLGGKATQTFSVNVATNRAPVITTRPTLVGTAGTAYGYQVGATDPEGQALSFTLLVKPAGMTIDAGTGQVSWLPTAADIGPRRVLVQVTDSLGGTALQQFHVDVRDQNAPPVFTSTPPVSVTAGTTLRYRAEVTDVDAVEFSLVTPAAGMTLDARTGLLVWNTASADLGVRTITVRATDERGLSTDQTFTLSVVPDTVAPKVSIGLTLRYANPGDQVTAIVLTSDNVAVASVVLLANGVPVTLDSQGRYIFTPNASGFIDLLATVTDTSGNVATATERLRVFDPTDTTGPVIDVDPALIESVITYLTDITGSVQDANLDYYKLEYARTGTNEWTQFAYGTSNVSGGNLGTFDPTMLLNDQYDIKITAADINGLIETKQFALSIEGNAKLGHFSLEFVDLSIPVAGIPIQILRRYDTRQANESGDFGFGWQLGYKEANIRETVPMTAAEQAIGILGAKGFRDGTRVYINTPDGRRVGFTFRPILEGANLLLGNIWKPHFEADPGVFETLTVADLPLSQAPDGTFKLSTFGFGYNPREYTLTTKDGVAYQYDQFDGLKDVTDRNGVVLTYTDTGIFSSTGESVQFLRDAQRRITQIIDPAGNAITYEYDLAGDLIIVTDQEENATQLTYLSHPSHYLDVVIDPLGNRAAKTTYDSAGRVLTSIDANGNYTETTYNLANNREVIRDRRGFDTTLIFDDRGNVLSTTDPLGRTITTTYDARDNVSSITNARGFTTTYEYDARGNVTAVLDAEGGESYFTYNALNDFLTTEDAAGRVTTFSYDDMGNLDQIVDALGEMTTFEYDPLGRITKRTDRRGFATNFTDIGASSQISSTTNAAGHTATAAYNFFGLPTEIVDENGNAIQFEYDQLGRVLSTIDAEGGISQFEWDFNRLVSKEDRRGNRTIYEYDANRQLIRQVSPDDGVVEWEYNENGQVIQMTDAIGRVFVYEYDGAGQLIAGSETCGCAIPGGGFANTSMTTYTYDAAGNVTTITDANGNETINSYDSLNRLLQTEDAEGGRQTFVYDSVGNRIGWVDANSHAYAYEYDALDRAFLVTDPTGGSISRVFDEEGNVTSQTDANGNSTYSTYDSLGQLTEAVDAEGGVVIYIYDAGGRLTSSTDANGHATAFEYDDLNRLLVTTDSRGGTTENVYDAEGNLRFVRDAEGHATEYRYDSMNRLFEAVDAIGGITRSSYNAVGQMLSVTDARGETVTFDYDYLGNVVKTTDATGEYVQSEYDVVGNRISDTDELGFTTHYEYDRVNRVTKSTDQLGDTTEFAYDAVGNLLTIKDPLDRTTRHTYDELNRKVTTTDPRGAINTTAYDNVGNVVSYLDPVGNEIEYTYDGLNRLISETNPLGAVRQYAYDAVGNRTQVTDRNGRVREFVYDELNHLAIETWLNGTTVVNEIVNEYDRVGNLLESSDGVSHYTFTYDALHRRVTDDNLGTANVPRLQLDYSYDAVGNVIETRDAEGVVVYASYDPRNLLESLAWEGLDSTGTTARVSIEYNARRERVRIERSNDALGGEVVSKTIYAQDPKQRLTSLVHQSASGSSVRSFAWSFNAADELVEQIINNQNTQYGYDLSGQLTAAGHSSQADEVYDYDLNGNRALAGYETGPANQLLSDGTFDYSYDEEGNLVERIEVATGEVTTYVYDHRNRMVGFEVHTFGGAVVRKATYVYDVFDRRILRTADMDGQGVAPSETVATTFNGLHAWADFDSGGDVAVRYLYGVETDEIVARSHSTAGLAWYLSDHLRTVHDILDSDGNVVDQIEYDSFGNIVLETNPTYGDRFKFTGREFDRESGLYYYRARFYDSRTGRFLAVDPMGPSEDSNPYRYVHNMPLMAMDPTGMTTMVETKTTWMSAEWVLFFSAMRVATVRVVHFTIGTIYTAATGNLIVTGFLASFATASVAIISNTGTLPGVIGALHDVSVKASNEVSEVVSELVKQQPQESPIDFPIPPDKKTANDPCAAEKAAANASLNNPYFKPGPYAPPKEIWPKPTIPAGKVMGPDYKAINSLGVFTGKPIVDHHTKSPDKGAQSQWTPDHQPPSKLLLRARDSQTFKSMLESAGIDTNIANQRLLPHSASSRSRQGGYASHALELFKAYEKCMQKNGMIVP